MNIKEALEWSKTNGDRKVSRAGNSGCGWIKRHDDFVYRLTFEDLTATDWEPAEATIERITSGRWGLVEG